MKKFIINILVFIGLFIAANFLYLKIVQHYDWNFKKAIEAHELSPKDYDILILGNSLAMDGLNTEILGSAYNLSIGGATLKTNEVQLKTYVEHADKIPETVILGMSSCLEDDLTRTTLHPVIQYVNGEKFRKIYDLPMLRFKWMAKVIIKRIISKDHRSAELVQGQLRISSTKIDNSTYPNKSEREIRPSDYKDIEAVKEIASFCRMKGINLILIEMPGIKSSQNEIPLGPYEFQDFQLYNFNNIEFCKIFDSNKDWLGGSHLNQEGADLFTNAIKGYLLD